MHVGKRTAASRPHLLAGILDLSNAQPVNYVPLEQVSSEWDVIMLAWGEWPTLFNLDPADPEVQGACLYESPSFYVP